MPKGIRVTNLLIFVWLASALPALAGSAVVMLYQKKGAAAGDQFGYSIASGDVNGDGKTDLIVGAPLASPGGVTNSGTVYVYSGADGSLLYQKNGAAAQDQFGFAVASVGDANGDGKADFAVGAPFATPAKVYVYSGADGALLYRIDGSPGGDLLGYSLAPAGDLNGDGKSDFIVSAPFASPDTSNPFSGAVYVYSGADTTLIYKKVGAGNFFGFSVASAGDVDGDGKPDFIVGAPFADSIGGSAGGSIYLYSGAGGALLYQKAGAASGDNFGSSVASAGDANGDGKSDFIVGASLAAPGGLLDAGSAYLYSGATGTLLFEKDGAASGDNFGAAVTSAGDMNGDGKADFLVGASSADPGGRVDAGSAYLYSGGDGSFLFQKDGVAAGDALGSCLSWAGGISGLGQGGFAIGASLANPGGLADAGSVFLYGSCGSAKGDLTADGKVTPADATAELYAVFLGSTGYQPCAADVNCDGILTPADAVIELNAVFLAGSFSSCQ